MKEIEAERRERGIERHRKRKEGEGECTREQAESNKRQFWLK